MSEAPDPDYSGELHVSFIHPRNTLVVERADLHITIGSALLDEIRAGAHRDVTLDGNTLTVAAENRTVVYRLLSQRPGSHWVQAERIELS